MKVEGGEMNPELQKCDKAKPILTDCKKPILGTNVKWSTFKQWVMICPKQVRTRANVKGTSNFQEASRSQC